MKKLATLLALILMTLPATAGAEAEGPSPSIAERTAGMTRMEGFLDLYRNEATGRLFLETDRFGDPLR